MADSTLLTRLYDTGITARTIGATTIPDLLRSTGYVIFDRLLGEDTVARIRQEFEPLFAATERDQRDLSGKNTRIGSVMLKVPSSRAIAIHPIMLSLANAILGANCELLQLGVSHGVRVYPGQWQRVPHRDDETWRDHTNGIEYLVSVLWALTDFTVNNGAPMLWPRSHLDRSSPDLDPTEAIVAEMPKGSALVYLGSLMHCGGANGRQEPLTALHFSYCLDWLRHDHIPFDSYPPAAARTFPEMLRGLLGSSDKRPVLRCYDGQNTSPRSETDSHGPSAATRSRLRPHGSWSAFPEPPEGRMPPPGTKQ